MSFLCTGASAADSSSSLPEFGKPRIIVENCTVEGGGLTSGAVCDVSISLKNVSPSVRVTSILVTGRWSGDSAPPVDFSVTNQSYIASINPGQTREVVFSLKTKSVNISALDTVPMYLDIAYSYELVPENINAVLLQLPVKDSLSGSTDSPVAASPASTGWLTRLLQPYDLQLVYTAGSVFFALAAIACALWRRKHR